MGDGADLNRRRGSGFARLLRISAIVAPDAQFALTVAVPNRLVHNSAMARPAEFDRNEARTRALRLFWRKGYQAASLTDLLDVMEIGRSSFYAAFGDKRSLFVECLDLYADHTQGFLAQARRQAAPLTAIEDFLALGETPIGQDVAAWGCLLVNTSLEMADVDPAVAAHASEHLVAVEGVFEAVLLERGVDPAQAQALAGLLMRLLEGLRVASRRSVPAKARHAQVRTAFRVLESTLN